MPTLASWAEAELLGYSMDADLPSYRRATQCRIVPIKSLAATAIKALSVLALDPWEAKDATGVYIPYAPITLYEAHAFSPLRSAFMEFHTAQRRPPRRGDWIGNVHVEIPATYMASIVAGAKTRLDLLLAELAKGDSLKNGHYNGDWVGFSPRHADDLAKTIIFSTGVVTMTDNSITVSGVAANVVGGQNNVASQGDAAVQAHSVGLASGLERLRAAIDAVPGAQGQALKEMMSVVENEASSDAPSRTRIVDLLKGIGAMAAGVGTAAPAITAAVEAVHSVLG